MEASFGSSFASVRVHADSDSARLNTAPAARAFTVGQDIAFAAGEYRRGRRRATCSSAHELAHTIQQGTGNTRASNAQTDLELERQAEQAAGVPSPGGD